MAKTSYYTVNGQIIGERTSGVRKNYGVDALGSVSGTISGSTIENAYEYGPYGNPIQASGPGSNPRFAWAGSSGYLATVRAFANVYVRARFFSPSLARWTTVDAMWPEEAAYGYVDAQAVTRTDPSGHSKIDPCSCNLKGKGSHTGAVFIDCESCEGAKIGIIPEHGSHVISPAKCGQWYEADGVVLPGGSSGEDRTCIKISGDMCVVLKCGATTLHTEKCTSHGIGSILVPYVYPCGKFSHKIIPNASDIQRVKNPKTRNENPSAAADIA